MARQCGEPASVVTSTPSQTSGDTEPQLQCEGRIPTVTADGLDSLCVMDNMCTDSDKAFKPVVDTSNKNLICNRCNKSFAKASYLKQHILVHSCQNDYVCRVCNKAFSRAGVLKRHMLVHTGQKNHVCSVCNKAFSQAGTLKRHVLVHTS